MSKCIYFIKDIPYITLNKRGNVVEKMASGKRDHMWKYGELPEDKEVIYHDFGFVYDNCNSLGTMWKDRTLFGDKEKLMVVIDGWDYSILKHNFVQLRLVTKTVKPQFYTMYDLMEKLTAEDFVDYCKDNGLSVCSRSEN